MSDPKAEADKMDVAGILAKIEWEGGLTAVLEYGLKADDLSDAARAEHPQFAQAWDAVCAGWEKVFQPATRLFEIAAQPFEDAAPPE